MNALSAEPVMCGDVEIQSLEDAALMIDLGIALALEKIWHTLRRAGLDEELIGEQVEIQRERMAVNKAAFLGELARDWHLPATAARN